MEKNHSLSIHLPSLGLEVDPHKMEDAYSMTLVLQVYRGLFRYTPEGELKPDLVESWRKSEDHKIITFKLRKGQFSNGAPITAENVRASFARIFLLGASIGADIDYISGSNAYRKSKKLIDLGISVIDSQTVELKLDRPSALIFKHLATVDCAILPIINPDEVLVQDEKLVASGPFRIASRDANEIKLIKWRSDPADSPNPPKNVSYFLAANPNPEQLFESKRTDSFDDDEISAALEEKLQANKWKKYVTELSREWFVLMQPDRLQLSVRKFLAARADKAVSTPVQPFLIQAFGLIPPGIAGGLASSDKVEYREALKSVPEPGPRTVKLTYSNAGNITPNIAKILKETWSSKNLTVTLDPVDLSTLLTRMFKKDYEVLIGGKGLDYPDGYSVLAYFKSGYDGNYFNVHDREIDRALDRLVTTIDQRERERGYRKLQIDILNKFTVVPLFFGSPSSGYWSNRVANVPPHPIGLHTLPLETVELK